MEMNETGTLDPPRIRTLTKEEIDRRIQNLVEQVAGLDHAEAEERPSTRRSLRPRWISAAELVRRVRRFIVYN